MRPAAHLLEEWTEPVSHRRGLQYGLLGGEDLLGVAAAQHRCAPWGLPMNLGQVINTAANERSPAVSRDGHYLPFAADRPGGFGALDIRAPWRPNSHDDFGWKLRESLIK